MARVSFRFLLLLTPLALLIFPSASAEETEAPQVECLVSAVAGFVLNHQSPQLLLSDVHTCMQAGFIVTCFYGPGHITEIVRLQYDFDHVWQGWFWFDYVGPNPDNQFTVERVLVKFDLSAAASC